MKQFELWVDESGSFSEDNLLLDNRMPSHVAGILYDSANSIDPIIGCAPEVGFHSTEQEDANILYEKFMEIAEKNIRFIIFQNKERLLLVDDKITYLNVLTEGIVQLLKRLKNIYGEFKLTILIAKRTDNPQIKEDTEKYGSNGYITLIKKNEYVKRLSEKLLLIGKRESVLENCWNIELGSAKEDKKLLLCDVVSNVFFTKDTKIKKRCSADAASMVNNIYNDDGKTWSFSVLEDPISADFYYLMSESKVGEAVSLLCQDKDERKIENRMKLVQKQLAEMSTKHIELQYRTISNLIQYYLTNSKDYQKCLLLLMNLEKFFVPALKSVERDRSDWFSPQLSFDIRFCMDTVYDHLGDIHNSKICEEICDQILQKLPRNWDYIMYLMKYQLRKINTQINLFDFEKAESNCSSLIAQNINIKEAIELAGDGSGDKLFNVKFPELAKSLNTRLQIRSLMIRNIHTIYDEAIKDLDAALKEFQSFQEKKRVYSNAIRIETEMGNEQNALLLLCKMFDVEMATRETDAKTSFRTILSDKIVDEYDLMTYIRLMSEGDLRGFKCSKEMYDTLKNFNAMLKFTNSPSTHPYEIICWKYASYIMRIGNYREAVKYYDIASDICFSTNMPTMMCIGLGIEFEKYAYALLQNDSNCYKYYRSIQKHYNKIQDLSLPCTMANLFGPLPDNTKNSDQAKVFMNLSRRITY